MGAMATAGGFAGASGTGATGRISSSRIIGAAGVGESIEVKVARMKHFMSQGQPRAY